MTIIEWIVGDFLRCGKKDVTLRCDIDDLVKVGCHCEYDPALKGKDHNEVLIPRKIEVKNEDGFWGSYPVVTWLDGVENEEMLVTRVIVKKTNEKGLSIMQSTEGVPDGELMCAAKETEILTETLNG